LRSGTAGEAWSLGGLPHGYRKETFMITIFMSKGNSLESIDELARDSWINVLDPSEDEIAYLCRELSIPQDFVMAALDIDERARTDKEGDAVLILWRVPLFRGRSADIPFTTIPFGVILANNVVITICKMENDIVQAVVNDQVSGLSVAKRNRFTLQLLLLTASRYLRYLRRINRKVDRLEDELQLSMRNEELLELLKYQKSLVYFTTALKSNELMMERLQRSRLFEMYPDDGDLLDDVLTENRQAIEMVSIANDILSQMMDAFASIISNNLNVVMKFLTSVTIVLMLPTLVASFYGMNVRLPLQDSPYAFLFTLIVSFVLSFAVVLVFLKKDWF